jgi:hypothetical protein
MKVFISHSWEDKISVQKIVDELKAFGFDVWMDAEDLLPGSKIQNSIDEVLRYVDVVLLVWSKAASESDGVMAEIDTSSKLEKIIIPCSIDSTPLDNDHIRANKRISFADFKSGMDHLKTVLTIYHGKVTNTLLPGTEELLSEIKSVIETSDHLIQKKKIKDTGTESDKDYWVGKVNNTMGESSENTQKLGEELAIMKEIMAFGDEKMSDYNANLGSQAECGRILNEIAQFRYAAHPWMRDLTNLVKDTYNSFDIENADQTITYFNQLVEEKLNASVYAFQQYFGFQDHLFYPSFDNISYFFRSSVHSLRLLNQYSKQANIHRVVADCVGELLRYIKTPGGVIDNSPYNILVLADDAHFIHSLVAYLQRGGAINTLAWGIDYNKVEAGSNMVFSIAGWQFKYEMDNNINGLCQALQAKHNPQHAIQQAHQEEHNGLEKVKDSISASMMMSKTYGIISSIKSVWSV